MSNQVPYHIYLDTISIYIKCRWGRDASDAGDAVWFTHHQIEWGRCDQASTVVFLLFDVHNFLRWGLPVSRLLFTLPPSFSSPSSSYSISKHPPLLPSFSIHLSIQHPISYRNWRLISPVASVQSTHTHTHTHTRTRTHFSILFQTSHQPRIHPIKFRSSQQFILILGHCPLSFHLAYNYHIIRMHFDPSNRAQPPLHQSSSFAFLFRFIPKYSDSENRRSKNCKM